MKKIFKYLILTSIIIFLTGCSGNYNLKINADLSIDESLELSIDNNDDAYNKTLKIFEENNISKDNYDVNISSNKVIIKYNDDFSSIEDYILNSKVYPQLFNEIKYSKNSRYIELSTKDKLKIKNKYNIIDGTNLTDLDVIQVNIENPFVVTLSNEDIVNDNIYTWSINNNDVNKTIKMQFKPTFNKFPYRPVIVGSLILILSSIYIIRIINKYRNSKKV